jgi:hypothetical protein
MSSDAEDQIINELANIRKEIVKTKDSISYRVASGIIFSTILMGFASIFLWLLTVRR